ncbi:MAG: BlaB/IND/MUS family subclass B1 metallo-beta-lactamase [Bacteroidales bacterium]
MKSLLSLFAFLFVFICLLRGQEENPGLKIVHLTDNFYVFTTWKKYDQTLFPSNGMYLVTDKGVVMFDTPWDETRFQPLLDSIWRRHKKEVIICISTHSHADRTAGLEYYRGKGIKTYTTKQTDDISKVKNEKRAEYLIYSDTVFHVGKYRFQVYYPGKGHAPDNIVVWFEKEKILYGGCFVKSMEANGLGNLEDADVEAWENSIINLSRKFGKPEFIVPGHQDWHSDQALDHTLQLIREYKDKK